MSVSDAQPAPLLGDDPRQPVAANTQLSEAAALHSDAYLAGKVQLSGPNAGHHWNDGTPEEYRTPADRAEAFDYGSRYVGENVSFSATTGDYALEQATLWGTSGVGHHQGLFYSISHRPNLFFDDWTEAGIHQIYEEDHPWQGSTFNAAVITSKFGREDPSDRFLTGVAYDDLDGDGFYSLGEGRVGVTISALGQFDTTYTAGGYALNLGIQEDPVEVEIDWNGETLRAVVVIGSGNIKLDVVGGSRLLASGNLTLLDGVQEGGLLGAADLSLTGNAQDNLLVVGRGDNSVDGVAGTNTVKFSGGFDDYAISQSAGSLIVSDLRDSALGDGVNSLRNVQFLQFADGLHTVTGARIADVSLGEITIDEPAFGSFLSALERSEIITLRGETQDIADGTEVLIDFAGVESSLRISSGQWMTQVMPWDLTDLENATDYTLTATAQTIAGPVSAEFDFRTTFDIPTLGTFASPFAETLDAQALDEGVTLRGITSAGSGSVTITLAGIAHEVPINDGDWEVHFPGSTISLLNDGDTYALPLQLIDEFDNEYGFDLPAFTADMDQPDPVPEDPQERSLTLSLRDLADASIDPVAAHVALDDSAADIAHDPTDGDLRVMLPAAAEGRLHVSRDWDADEMDITARDALDVLRLAVGLTPSFGAAQPQHFVAADINRDGQVTALDALEVLRAAVGLQTEHAPEWLFFDASTDWEGLALGRSNTEVTPGLDLGVLDDGASSVDMTGILLGSISDF